MLDITVNYIILIILICYILFWVFGCNTDKGEGFENNNYYFQGNENDSMYVGRLMQPTLIHRLST